MRFDAYNGNVSGSSPEEVATLVARAFRGRIERGRPRGRYGDVFEVKDGTEGVGWVGHDCQQDTAFFEFKGACTPASVEAIRKHWALKHTVSRLDSCEDFDEPESFPRLVQLVDRSTDPRVKSDIIAPRNGDRGTTVYWGSKTSAVMARCYEAGKMKDRLHFGRPNWVRVEVQVRPNKPFLKQAAAQITALEAWGFAAWTKRAAEVMAQIPVPRLAVESTPPTFDGTTLYLARAFRRHFEEMLADLGDWECIGREIRAIWDADEKAAQQAAQLSQEEVSKHRQEAAEALERLAAVLPTLEAQTRLKSGLGKGPA